MDFIWNNRRISLRGESHSKIEPIHFNQLKRLQHSHSVASSFQLLTMNNKPPSLLIDPKYIPPEITSLLLEFPNLFTNPDTLPPSKTTDHQIPLKPHTTPISTHPNRYLIECLINEMNHSGIIRPSTSPFSSPAFLVKKTRWYMAVLRQLSSLKRGHCSKQISYSHCR